MKTPTSTRTRRTVRVIGPPSEGDRMKCPECGNHEMHIYKLDTSLYFCGNCTYTMPVHELRRDMVIVPPPDTAKEGTFIVQSKRKPSKPTTVMQQNLRDKGFDLTDYYETSADDTTT